MEYGLRTIIGWFLIVALTQSGMIRSLAKSPPPITLPALAVEMAGAAGSEKNDFL